MKNNKFSKTISYLAKISFVLAFVLIGTKAFATEMVTLSISNVTTNSATVSARVTAFTTDTTIRGSFEYATNPSFISSNYTNEITINLASTVSFSQALTGLTPNTTYYVRALGIGNNEGVAKPGSTLTFKTDKVVTLTAPTVAMTVATSTSTTTANVELFYNDNSSGNVSVWFEYGTSSSFGSTTAVATKTGFGNYQATISGLTENITYYVRAVAKNSVNTVYSSSTLMFKTDSSNNGGGNGNNNPTYVYGCMNPSDQNYNPNANYHVESYCYGTNNNNNNNGSGWGFTNWDWPWLTWGNVGSTNYNGTNNTNNNYNHGSYTDPNDVKGTTSKSTSTSTKSSSSSSVKSTTKTASKDSVDANQYLASAMFGLGNGFLPTTLIGWLLLTFLILLLIVLTRHYFNKKPKPVEVKKV